MARPRPPGGAPSYDATVQKPNTARFAALRLLGGKLSRRGLCPRKRAFLRHLWQKFKRQPRGGPLGYGGFKRNCYICPPLVKLRQFDPRGQLVSFRLPPLSFPFRVRPGMGGPASSAPRSANIWRLPVEVAHGPAPTAERLPGSRRGGSARGPNDGEQGNKSCGPLGVAYSSFR